MLAAKATARGARGRNSGFTLIEVMIVVVIVAILVAIGVPLYQEQVKRTYRTSAQSDLMGFAQAVEKEYALNFTYATADVTSGSVYPDESPLDGNDKYYDLEVVLAELSTTQFTLRAVPKAGTILEDDGALYLDHLGRRKWDRNDNGDPNEPGELSWDVH